MDLRSMRWLTVAPPDQPGVEILLEQPGAPFMDADAVEQHRGLTPKGMAPAVFLEVDDCRAKFDAVVARASRSSGSRSSASTASPPRSATTRATTSAWPSAPEPKGV